MTSSRQLLRYGMFGGGEGAFIGAIHRMASALDGRWSLVAGAFSSDANRAARSGAMLNLPAERTYLSLEAMLDAESGLPDGERMQALVIATPNHLHAPAAIAALDAGFHVLSEKPMALDLLEAQRIAEAVRRSGRQYALAFTYSAYPLIEEARLRIARGDFGAIRLVQVQYTQGWLSQPVDELGNKQAKWRTDPIRAGLGGCLGDIGTHAFHLAEHVSGLRVEQLSADLATHVAGRRLDDDVSAMLRFDNGARGLLKATQVAAGEENDLVLKVHGELGGLEWHQMEPNSLMLRWSDRPAELLRTGGPGLAIETMAKTRTPGGHPEGYIEAFANIYAAFADSIRDENSAVSPRFPGVEDGLRTMAFVEAVVSNSNSDQKWTSLQASPLKASG